MELNILFVNHKSKDKEKGLTENEKKTIFFVVHRGMKFKEKLMILSDVYRKAINRKRKKKISLLKEIPL